MKVLEGVTDKERDPLRAILESMTEGVYSTDLVGRVLWLNGAAERIAGRRASDVVGRNYVEALGLADEAGLPLSQAQRPLECCIEAKRPVYLPQVFLRRPDGERVPVALSTSPILDPSGGPASCVAVLRDLSRDRELEEMKADLISLVSHELRTPLGHIRGFASSLLQRDVEWDAATREEFLRDIEREAERLDRLITGLLDMSRMQAGLRDVSERRPTPPWALVALALEHVGKLLDGREVVVDVPADLPEIDVDASSMDRVMVDLLENALKYSPAGTPIRVGAARVGDSVSFAVEDRGPGIPPGERERIFEPFVRLSAATGVAVPGVGLGLAICQSAVAAHGGTIQVEDREGGGARFVVSLPVAARSTAGRA